MHYKNDSIEKVGRTITTIVKKSKGQKTLTTTVERCLNNDYIEILILKIYKSYLQLKQFVNV